MKLTLEKIEAMIFDETFLQEGTLTLCVLRLTNGAQVVGKSNVIDPANYDAELGRSAARGNAVGQIWELEGYALKTRGVVKGDGGAVIVRGRPITELPRSELEAFVTELDAFNALLAGTVAE